jgi:predicted nucleotide-binding protein
VDEETTFRSYNVQLLRTLFDRNDVADLFDKRTTPFEFRIGGKRVDWHNQREIAINEGSDPKEVVIERIRRQVNELTRLRGTLSTIPRVVTNRTVSTKGENIQLPMSPTKVFVVHGHALGPRAEVARLLERLGLEPLILAEQPNAGATLIEKLLAHADVSFAIVLATADDVGAPKDGPTTQSRARQNVVVRTWLLRWTIGT